MSMPEIRSAIEKLSQEDKLTTVPGFCRHAAREMMKVATTADISEPQLKKSFLVYPYPDPHEEYIHYAIEASDGDKCIIFNICASPTFPVYIGLKKEAPGRLSQMIPSDEVL